MKKENIVICFSILAIVIMFIFSMWALSIKPEKEDTGIVELVNHNVMHTDDYVWGVEFQLKNYNSEKKITVTVEIQTTRNEIKNKTLTLEPNEVVVDYIKVQLYDSDRTLYSIRIIQ